MDKIQITKENATEIIKEFRELKSFNKYPNKFDQKKHDRQVNLIECLGRKEIKVIDGKLFYVIDGVEFDSLTGQTSDAYKDDKKNNSKHKWNSIVINKQNIITETDKAILVKMPKSTGYEKHSFWHPKKLAKKGKGWDYHLSFSDESEIIIRLYGAGRFNKTKVIEEIKFCADDFLDLFEK